MRSRGLRCGLAAAIVAMLVLAAPAWSQESVEVVDEGSGSHCSDIAAPGHLSGGCPLHLVGSMEVRVDLGVFGEFHEATCGVEVDGRIGEDAGLAIDSLDLTPGEANCTDSSAAVWLECDLPWEATSQEDGALSTKVSASICINPAESSSDCVGTLTFGLTEQAGEHLTAAISQQVGLCEITGALEVEHAQTGNTDVHINHLGPVEVVNEGSGSHCSDVATPGHLSGGCPVHLAGTMEVRLDLGVFGETHEATCNVEMDARMGEDGTLAVAAVGITPGEANCSDDPAIAVWVTCDLPWEGNSWEQGDLTTTTSVSICLNPAESSTDCVGELTFDLVEQTGEHLTVAFVNHLVGLCEIDADLEVEHTQAGNTDIHINHL